MMMAFANLQFLFAVYCRNRAEAVHANGIKRSIPVLAMSKVLSGFHGPALALHQPNEPPRVAPHLILVSPT
jgi:hypothetical protein